MQAEKSFLYKATTLFPIKLGYCKMHQNENHYLLKISQVLKTAYFIIFGEKKYAFKNLILIPLFEKKFRWEHVYNCVPRLLKY